MFNGLSNGYLYTAFRITTVFVLRNCETPITKVGTAFLVRNRADVNCFVTNRHMVDLGYGDLSGKYKSATLITVSFEMFVAPAEDRMAKPVHRSILHVDEPRASLKFAADYFEDVACFVNPIVRYDFRHTNLISFYVEWTHLADEAWIDSQLSVSDFVAFPGYPPWYDKLENRPILRTGTIASDPRANYSNTTKPEGRRVAYEAFSFGGSSGSPVYATPKGMRGGNGIEVSGYREGRLVGINAGHLEGSFGTHSGVSYFVKSSAILELINNDG